MYRSPTQCQDSGYGPYYAYVDKANPNEGVECKADSVRPNLDQAGKTHDEVTPALNYITSFLYLIFDEVITPRRLHMLT